MRGKKSVALALAIDAIHNFVASVVETISLLQPVGPLGSWIDELQQCTPSVLSLLKDTGISSVQKTDPNQQPSLEISKRVLGSEWPSSVTSPISSASLTPSPTFSPVISLNQKYSQVSELSQSPRQPSQHQKEPKEEAEVKCQTNLSTPQSPSLVTSPPPYLSVVIERQPGQLLGLAMNDSIPPSPCGAAVVTVKVGLKHQSLIGSSPPKRDNFGFFIYFIKLARFRCIESWSTKGRCYCCCEF